MNADKHLTVLMVEDEPADAHLARLAFSEGQVLVDLHHVIDGVEAFEFLQRQGKYQLSPIPDIIMLDLNMPRMDGRTFLKKIKADPVFRVIPVVVLTTSRAEADMLECYQQSAAGFIVKPVDVDDFIRVLRGLGNYWVKIVRLPDLNRLEGHRL